MSTPINGTHQHAKSGKVYEYRADYRTEDGDIHWWAEVQHDGELCMKPEGHLATQTPAADAIAPGAVLDAVVKAIDQLDDPAQGL